MENDEDIIIMEYGKYASENSEIEKVDSNIFSVTLEVLIHLIM